MGQLGKDERGSALIELLVTFPLIAGVVAGILVGMYLRFTKIWMDYQGYEAMMCVAEGQPIAVCKRQFQHHVRPFLYHDYDRYLERAQLSQRGHEFSFYLNFHNVFNHRRYGLSIDQHERLPNE